MHTTISFNRPGATSGRWGRLLASAGLLAAAAVSAPVAFATDIGRLAGESCASCHGPQFSGGKATALAGAKWRRAHNDNEAAEIVANGLADVGMPAFADKISASDRAALIRYIRDCRPAPAQPSSGGSGAARVFKTERQSFRLERVSSGYQVPWSFAFLPDGKMIVTERPGRLRIVEQGRLSDPIRGTPKVWYRQDGGLLSLALDPDYVNNGWVYLSFSDPGSAPWTSMTKIVRGRIRDGAWVDQQVVFQADAKWYKWGSAHYGCRLRFIEGKLFFTIGERDNLEWAQDLSSPGGKVHRVDPDGKIPADNPFVGRPNACPSVWTYGHRNPQGLAVDPRTGETWEAEHGPHGGDEINHLRRGENYGWPVVTFGVADNGDIISNLTTKEGMADPVTHWSPSIAPCPIHFSTSDRYPGWKYSLLVGSLAARQLRRLELDGDKLVHEEVVLKNLGRIRDIVTGPDGYLYLAVEYWDRSGEILRLVPEL